MYCLARDMLPLSTVDKPGFQSMIQKFNSWYRLPTRKHFTKAAIPALVNEVEESGIKEKIKIKQLHYYSGTTDLWTLRPIYDFHCLFIDTNWDLISYCLQTHYLPVVHNIAEATYTSGNLK